MSSPPLQPLSLRHDVGEEIKDRYIIRDVLGAGAFGTVYRVEEMIGSRTVTLACKEMHVLDDPSTSMDERTDALRMFEEEAFLLQTLRNPHIPAAYFESAKGVWLACPVCGRTFKGTRNCPDHGSVLQVVKDRYYLLMDFIDGPDLEAKLAENGGRPLGETQVIDWMLQICDALETVHAKGLSHRDIKPANIKLRQDNGQAMLIDFGLVKPSTVVGGYGTVLMRKSTGLGTLGYAPSSPREQQQPDARTDILALGMTMYRLLTGLDPTDQAQLDTMRAKTPHKLNSSVSMVMNDIILKAITPEPEHRYPNVAALKRDLQGARFPIETTCPHCGFIYRSAQPPGADTPCPQCGRLLVAAPAPKAKAATAKPAPVVPGNPYEARITQIRAEIAAPMPVISDQYDDRIKEIEASLALSEQFVKAPVNTCPACHRAQLLQVTGQPSNLCPICNKARLEGRVLDLNLCPVCREGALEAGHVHDGLPFCAVCRTAPVLLDQRRKLGGIIVDDWWKCPFCKAEYDVLNNGRAVLESAGDDPFGLGAGLLGQTHSFNEWQQLAARALHFFTCSKCSAQFDVTSDNQLTLMTAPLDTHGTGARHRGATLPRGAWAKIAQGVSPEGGTHFCPNDHLEWNYDESKGTLTLLDPDHKAPNWAQAMAGKAVSLQEWACAGAGKVSHRPGLLCPSCRTEFDLAGALLQLVGSPAQQLQPHVGQSLTLTDWHRRAAGAPTSSEAGQLRNELARLQVTRAQEQDKVVRGEQQRRLGLQEELSSLYKQAILSGFIPVHRVSGTNSVLGQTGTYVVIASQHTFFLMQPGEKVRWESPATDGMIPQNAGGISWLPMEEGFLVVTSERIMFAHNNQIKWKRYVVDFNDGETFSTARGTRVLLLRFKSSIQPVGVELGSVTWKLMVDGQSRDMTFAPEDLMMLLKTMQTWFLPQRRREGLESGSYEMRSSHTDSA